MHNTKKITVKCSHCKKDVEKLLKEYKRRIKNGYNRFYCNYSCATYGNSSMVANFGKNSQNISGFKRRNDEFSSFRYFISKAKSKERKSNYGETDLTVEYLKEIWEKQQGLCPYTGIKMNLPINTQDSNIKGTPVKASLDRIDSSKGYTKGNVEFVCLSVNYAKNGFSRQEMIDFFNSIKK